MEMTPAVAILYKQRCKEIILLTRQIYKLIKNGNSVQKSCENLAELHELCSEFVRNYADDENCLPISEEDEGHINIAGLASRQAKFIMVQEILEMCDILNSYIKSDTKKLSSDDTEQLIEIGKSVKTILSQHDRMEDYLKELHDEVHDDSEEISVKSGSG